MTRFLVILFLLPLVFATPSLPSARFISLRTRFPICRPRLVYRTGACLCSIAFNQGTIYPNLSDACRNLYKRSPRFLSKRCLSLKGEVTTPEQVFANAKTMLDTCFTNVDQIVLPPGSKEPGPRGGTPVATILMWLTEVKYILGAVVDNLETSFIPPAPSAPARIVVLGDNVKEKRLVSFNDLRV